jgi:protein TonB
MAQLAPLAPPPLLGFHGSGSASEPERRFECLLLAQPEGQAKKRSATLTVSLVVHGVLLALVLLVPILTYDALPAPSEAVRAFFVSPPEVAPPPPPPPPPPAGARRIAKTPAAPTPPPEARFVAPVDVPDELKPEPGLDLGAEGGIPGGVEGGVPGGVLGGIVGGLPAVAPPAPVNVVRVGGQIKTPKLVHSVPPVYPELGVKARLSAVLILEAQVDTGGRVKTVSVLRGAPLFDEAAVEAVKQWRYQPLLLNGVPTEFILTVTVKFNLIESGRR